MTGSLKVPTIFTAVDKMSTVVKKMSSSVGSFSKKSIAHIKRFDQKITSSFKKLGKVNQLIAGLGAAQLFYTAIRGNIAFNDSLASVSAITGATGDDLIRLEQLATKTAKAHKKAGADVLKAYELVGSAKPELLKNLDALDETTRSVILLGKASRLDLETSSLSLTGVMNQFNKKASDSVEVVDALAAGAKYGAAQIPMITESILKFGTGAKSFNVSLHESVALVETFAAKGIMGAEAGTKLRNILTKMSATGALPPEAIRQLEKYGVNTKIVSDKTIPLVDRLKELSKISKDSTALVKVFGLENKEAGQILLENIGMYEQLTKSVKEQGVANDQATKNTDTLKFAIESIKTSFVNATTATNGNNKALNLVKKSLFFVADNMETVVAILGILTAAFVALKVVTGIITAIEVATKIWTAAQWLLNIAMDANPIGIIILAIGALISLVTVIVQKYDSWGAAATMLLGPLGTIINLVMAFKKNWDKIVEAFKSEGILGGLKAIRNTIIEALIKPVEQFLNLIKKIPGLGKVGDAGLRGLERWKTMSGYEPVNPETETPKLNNPQAESNNALSEKITENKLAIDINNGSGNDVDVKSSGPMDIPIKVTNTQGAQ